MQQANGPLQGLTRLDADEVPPAIVTEGFPFE
jgi:hypothetical protein